MKSHVHVLHALLFTISDIYGKSIIPGHKVCFQRLQLTYIFLEDSWKVWNEVFEIIWSNHFEKISSFYRLKKCVQKPTNPHLQTKTNLDFFFNSDKMYFSN